MIKHLQSHGIRPSLHRTEVIKYMNEHRNHPSVETIYEALSPRIPTLSKTTIYNILNLFVAKGVVVDITIDPRQCRYDSVTAEHVHFLCENCGELYDINTEPIKIETEHLITRSQLFLKGICINCQHGEKHLTTK